MNLYRILVLLGFYTCSHWLSAQQMSMTYEDRVALAKVLRNGEEKAALSALETAIANKDYLVIGQGIGSMSWTISVSATEAMLETKEKQFLPFLLSGYEGFQGALTGGDEMRGFQIEITQKLLHSMFQILHPDVSMPEVFGKEEEKRIIDEVKVIRSQMEKSQANEEKKVVSNSPTPYNEMPRIIGPKVV